MGASFVLEPDGRLTGTLDLNRNTGSLDSNAFLQFEYGQSTLDLVKQQP
jgi:hypothetical protein